MPQSLYQQKVDLNKLIIIDLEVLKTFFCACCRDYVTGQKKVFSFFNHKDFEQQPLAFYKFLRTVLKAGYTLVTFNGISYDTQILHYFYEWCNQKVDPLYELEIKEVIDALYAESQRLIGLQRDDKAKNLGLIYEDDLLFPTIDLLRQNHYDRPAKATSLKWLQFTMQLPTVKEMPLPHDGEILYEQVDSIVEYCWNDVDSTYEFFNRVKFETELRLAISKEYGKNLINASEPKMAREIFGKLLADEMQISLTDLRKLKTVRKWVAFNDIIFPYIKFITPELQVVLNGFKKIVVDTRPNAIDELKLSPDHWLPGGEEPNAVKDFKYSFNYKGLKIDLGLGGIHSCAAPGIYAPTADETMEDADVTSFYPKLAIENGLRPRHLGDSFSKIYNDIFLQRQQIPKKDPRNYTYKILLNSTYGLSSEINSFFYDKAFTYAITVNGQLSLLMLVEALYKAIPGIRFVQKNTDGVTYIYNNKYKEIVAKVCAWWQKVTKMQLEYAYYSKMIIQDVNNYIGVYTDAAKAPKKKGLFETTIMYHKNPSYLVVTKALENYFVNNIPIEQSIKSHNQIYDFFGGVKKKRDFKLNLHRNVAGNDFVEEQEKVTRYIIATPGGDSGLLFKEYQDGRKTAKIGIVAGMPVLPVQTVKPGFEDPKRYPINYDWYCKEARKIVESIMPPVVQKQLF